MFQEQTWWNKNAQQKQNHFQNWVGDCHATSKQQAARQIQNQQQTSVQDFGCGNGTFADSLKSVGANILQTGLDSCKFFLQLNRDQNRAVIDTDLRKVPAEDSIVECAFSRHTFEHQDCFETILSEMIRIGKKEAMHIFFIQPRDKTEINYDAAIDLYHNHQSIADIETFLKNQVKVKHWTWVDIPDTNETCLHILLT